ncbi:ribonuclease H-like domain-containing protein [Tanacetum coccineum]
MTSSTDLAVKEKEAFIDPNSSYLFSDRALANIKLNNLSGNQRPPYPSPRPAKHWDKLEAQLKNEEKDEKLDGGGYGVRARLNDLPVVDLNDSRLNCVFMSSCVFMSRGFFYAGIIGFLAFITSAAEHYLDKFIKTHWLKVQVASILAICGFLSVLGYLTLLATELGDYAKKLRTFLGLIGFYLSYAGLVIWGVGMFAHDQSLANTSLSPIIGIMEYLCLQLIVTRRCYEVDKFLHNPTTEPSSTSVVPLTSEEIKSLIADIAKDNKRSRTNALKAELRSIKLGDQSMVSYFQKIDSIVTILTSLESYVNEEDVVHYAIEGLPDKYEQVIGYMHYQDKFPDLKMVRSLLIAEEMRLRTKALASPIDSSSHMVLMAQSGTNRRSSSQVKSSRPCFNFAKGSCRFGSNCRHVHDSNVKPPSSSTPSIANNVTDELLMKLLEKLGLQSGSNVTSTTPPYASNFVALSPGLHSADPSLVSAQQQVQPPPSMVTAQPAQPDTSGPITTTRQATILPSAFTTDTLHDPSTGAWHMDSGATSHLNSSVYNLSDVPSHSRSLHLNNVLITPHIVKNLISVRQFVCDNNCTVEFDVFGFSVKDFMTRQVLLRCDNTGDLYPVTAQSPIPHVLLVSQHMWHQRLGHPRSDVLRRLVSNKFISCNKEKPPVLCHACQTCEASVC